MLDFDGTLSPIVERPEQALLPAETRRPLAELSTLGAVSVAIVSGRAVADVRQRVGLDGVFYVGNHGREILRPGQSAAAVDCGIAQQMAEVCKVFARELSHFPDVTIENKGVTVALHYRRVPAAQHEAVRRRILRVAGELAGVIEASEGKRVFDVVPLDDVSKGKTVGELLEQYGGIDAVLPVYCGDDTTDESAFRALPPEAITVYVGGAEKVSEARYRLDDPAEVRTFLERILAARRSAAAEGR